MKEKSTKPNALLMEHRETVKNWTEYTIAHWKWCQICKGDRLCICTTSRCPWWRWLIIPIRTRHPTYLSISPNDKYKFYIPFPIPCNEE
jgi:hypothetical protein